jgi:glycosyltransferase involved in cell wall biosynthesis
MSIGLPVVATDCSPGGARMLIEDRVNGCLVPRGDVDAIADSILYLLENENIADNLGRKATEIVERFAPEKISGLWEGYINKIIGDKYAG